MKAGTIMDMLTTLTVEKPVKCGIFKHRTHMKLLHNGCHGCRTLIQTIVEIRIMSYLLGVTQLIRLFVGNFVQSQNVKFILIY